MENPEGTKKNFSPPSKSSGYGQLNPDQGLTHFVLGKVAALPYICYFYCLSITNLSASQQPTLAPERPSSIIKVVYSVCTTCAEDYGESRR